MKILFCIDRYRPSKGGAETYLRDLGAALAQRGHSITIAALSVEEDGNTRSLLVRAPSFPRVLREIAFARRISRLKQEGGYDLSLIHI